MRKPYKLTPLWCVCVFACFRVVQWRGEHSQQRQWEWDTSVMCVCVCIFQGGPPLWCVCVFVCFRVVHLCDVFACFRVVHLCDVCVYLRVSGWSTSVMCVCICVFQGGPPLWRVCVCVFQGGPPLWRVCVCVFQGGPPLWRVCVCVFQGGPPLWCVCVVCFRVVHLYDVCVFACFRVVQWRREHSQQRQWEWDTSVMCVCLRVSGWSSDDESIPSSGSESRGSSAGSVGSQQRLTSRRHHAQGHPLSMHRARQEAKKRTSQRDPFSPLTLDIPVSCEFVTSDTFIT